MVWDAGAFMKIAIGLFFLACGAGMSYALVRLAAVLQQLTGMLHDVNGEFVPILSRLQTTVDEVNSELNKIDEITGSVVSVTDTIGNTTSAIQRAIGSPVKKVAGFSAGVAETLSSLFSGRQKEK